MRTSTRASRAAHRLGRLTLLLTLAAPTLGPTSDGRAYAEPSFALKLEDPSGDDDGPGSYVYPSNQAYRRGSYDLESVELRVDGGELLIAVRFRANLWKPPETRRSEAARFLLENAIYVQHVDLYIDHTPGEGHVEALPGRNVTIEPSGAWDVAIVLTPRPFLLRSLIREWPPSRSVLVPANLRSYKNVVEARVPVAALGAIPDESWGFAVAVSGALWENTFDALDRLVGGPVQNALTMPVVTVAEPLAFGGGELEPYHPFVIDILVPPGTRQHAVLSRYDVERRRLAALPVVYPNPAAHRARLEALGAATASTAAEAKPDQDPSSVVTRIVELRDQLAVLERPAAGALKAYQLGFVQDDDGDVVGRVVVTSVHAQFVLATVVKGADQVRVGATVRFQRSPQPCTPSTSGRR